MYGLHGNCNRGGHRGGGGRGRGRGYGRGRGGRHNQSSVEDHNCILPLKSTLTNDKINKVKVKCRHSNANTREAQIITFDSTVPCDKELMLRSYHDFMNNTGDDALNCNSGERLFQCFRQTLGATQKTKWDAVIAPCNAPGGPGRTPATFGQASMACVNEVLGPGAASKQRSYFDRLNTKPHAMSPQECWDRIQEINLLLIPCTDNHNGVAGPLSNECCRSLFERLQTQTMKDEALKQNITAANPNVNDSALVTLCQNLYAVERTSKKRANSFQSDRRSVRSRTNNYRGNYGRPYQNPYQQGPFPPRYGSPPAPGYSQGCQGGRNPGRGGRGFPSRGGRGCRGGCHGAGRSTGAHHAEDEPPPEPDHEESQPPDLDSYAEDQHAESYDDSFCAGVPEHHTPPGHCEACCDETYEGPHPWGYHEDYGEH